MDLPEEIEVVGQTWKQLPPGLYMRNHIGEIAAPDGTVFEISSSLNGLSIYLETPFKRRDPADPRNLMEFSVIYALNAAAGLKALAASLINLKEATNVA